MKALALSPLWLTVILVLVAAGASAIFVQPVSPANNTFTGNVSFAPRFYAETNSTNGAWGWNQSLQSFNTSSANYSPSWRWIGSNISGAGKMSCDLVLLNNSNGNQQVLASIGNVANATNTTFPRVNLPDTSGNHSWCVQCYDYNYTSAPGNGSVINGGSNQTCAGGVDFGRTSNYTLRVDNSTPSVVLMFPATATYNYGQGDVNPSIYVQVNVTDDNVGNCSIYHNINGSYLYNQSVATGGGVINITSSPANYSNFTANDQFNLSVLCKDTQNNSVSTSNVTVTLDWDTPGAVNCLTPGNSTRSTDHGLTLTWSNISNTGEQHFSKYQVVLAKNSSFITPEYVFNITDTETRSVSQQVQVSANTHWYWYVNASDSAGNFNVSGNCTNANPFQFQTRTEGRNLSDGWNSIGWLRAGETNLSQIANEINSISVVSAWNYTSNSFITYTAGSTVNNAITVIKGELVLVYNNLTASNEGDSTVAWESHVFAAPSIVLHNISNASAQRWNPIGITNETDAFTNVNLNNVLNCLNLSAQAWWNRSTQTFVVMPCNVFTANVTYALGDVVWVAKNKSMSADYKVLG